MLKRLIIAAMILGIFLVFGSVAFADTGPGAPDREPADRPALTPQNPDKLMRLPDLSAPDGFQRLGAPISQGWDNASPASPEYGCEVQDFCEYTGSYWQYQVFGTDGSCWANKYLVKEHHYAV